MIVVMRRDATERQIEAVIERLVNRDFDVHRSTGVERTILGVVGTGLGGIEEAIRGMEGVKEVIRVSRD
jgi:hypothetical protein